MSQSTLVGDRLRTRERERHTQALGEQSGAVVSEAGERLRTNLPQNGNWEKK